MPRPRAAGGDRQHAETRLAVEHVLGVGARLIGHVRDAAEGVAISKAPKRIEPLDAGPDIGQLGVVLGVDR